DNGGNLYIVECKIKGNQDMKTIRGQITDYAAGLWSEKISWEKFQLLIEESSSPPVTLDKILELKMKEDKDNIQYVKKQIEQNFENGEYFLVFAVDQMNRGLKDVIDWHNDKLDQGNKYPMFSLELKRYPSEGEKPESIVMQNYPYNLGEIKIKKLGEKRNDNTESDWDQIFKKADLKNEEKNKINDFTQKLKKMVEDDKGRIDYGSGMPVFMPKFFSSDQRSAIKLKADGGMNLQFHLLEGEYRAEADEFKKDLFNIPELRRLIEKSRSKGTVPLKIDEWLPHKDEILQILIKVFVRK
ncbi:MAG TPA: hypothetical protein VJ571_07815, partial [Candidatus Nitrosotalea sp.]|nr:hypothetical protein [Candidatus Nitrosotalea sp.]